MRVIFTLGVVLAGLFFTACGDSGERAGQEASWSRLETFAGPDRERLQIPEGPPPTEVDFTELKPGQGPSIERGDRFTVEFVTFNYSTGKVRESFWRTSTPFSYSYGVGETVIGWEDGLKGIRAGGVRELIVPADQAYGGDALVYLVKILEIEPG